MSDYIKGYCSSCYNKSTHKLIKQNYLRRNIYKCLSCGKKTVMCRFCDNFANADNKDELTSWDDELCAEHNGLVNFKMINKNFNQLENFYKTRSFEIKKIKSGKGVKIIFINGFLTSKLDNIDDWKKQLEKIYPNNSWYYLSWGSETLYDLGMSIVDLQTNSVIIQTIMEPSKSKKIDKNTILKLTKIFAKQGAKKLFVFNKLLTVYNATNHPWFAASIKAEQTGILLSNILARTKDKYILCGHSLGAKVIYHALESLATKDEKIIDTVHLLGGAVGSDKESWKKVKNAVREKIYNYKSDNDYILASLYKLGTFFTSNPIGRNSIDIRGIKNIDVSYIVNGHGKYKENFAKFAKI